jgi:hypothetical protein
MVKNTKKMKKEDNLNPITFIIRWCNSVEEKFPTVRLRYAYDETTDFHIVEVSPISVEQSDEFGDMYLDFSDKFFELFPTEDLLVCEPYKYNNMTHIIYETPIKKGMSWELSDGINNINKKNKLTNKNRIMKKADIELILYSDIEVSFIDNNNEVIQTQPLANFETDIDDDDELDDDDDIPCSNTSYWKNIEENIKLKYRGIPVRRQ